MSQDSDRFYNYIFKSLDERRASNKDDDKELKRNIAARLIAYRDMHRLSQDGLAVKLKVSRRQVMRWEAQESKPSNLAMEMMKELGIMKEW